MLFLVGKQQTQEDIYDGLVGEVMCIRDTQQEDRDEGKNAKDLSKLKNRASYEYKVVRVYTSDAADEEDSIDVGLRRIHQKRTTLRITHHSAYRYI